MMNLLVILAALQICHGYQWNTHSGPVQDTPEVAHAKAEHFAAVAKAKAQSDTYDRSWAPENSWNVPHYSPQVKYHGPIALPPGYDKHGAPLPVLDTPEVAHVKADRIASIAKAGGDIYPSSGTEPWSEDEGKWSPVEDKWSRSDVPQHYGPANSYKGPIAYSPGYDKNGAPLPVLETPEVSHAKALHFATYAKAAASHTPSGHRWRRSLHAVSAAKHAHYAAVNKAEAEIASAAHYNEVHNSWAAPHYAPTVMYHGPIALPPGYDKNGAPLPVQDTPEVAHAKAIQLSLIAKAGGDIYPSVHHSGIESGSYEGSSWSAPQIHHQYASNHIRYHGPIAYSPGYDKNGAPLPVQDTPEVAHAKAVQLSLIAKAGGDISPSVHHSGIESDSYEGSSWSTSETPKVAHTKAEDFQMTDCFLC